MYYLARYLTGSRAAAAVAAVLFAFCPYIWARTAHIQLLMTAGLPFSLLAAHRMIDRPDPAARWCWASRWSARRWRCGYYGVFAGLVGRPRQPLLPGRAPALDAAARSTWRWPAPPPSPSSRIWPFYQRYLGLHSAEPAVPRTRGSARILGELGGVPGSRRPRQRLGEDGGAAGQRRPMAGGAVPGPRHADSGGLRRGCRCARPGRTRPPAGARSHSGDRGVLRRSWPCSRPGCRSAPTRGCTRCCTGTCRPSRCCGRRPGSASS